MVGVGAPAGLNAIAIGAVAIGNIGGGGFRAGGFDGPAIAISAIMLMMKCGGGNKNKQLV